MVNLHRRVEYALASSCLEEEMAAAFPVEVESPVRVEGMAELAGTDDGLSGSPVDKIADDGCDDVADDGGGGG